MKAIRVHEYGGPEQLRYEEIDRPAPGPDEVRVKIEAVGLNYIDVYRRTGLYPGTCPFIPGTEAAGRVDAVGAHVVGVNVGDRVASAALPNAYADYAIAPAAALVPIPHEIDTPTAAAVLLQGMTAHYLAYSTYPLHSGAVAVVHAAAGGVGLLLVQLAKRSGARVIATVSTAEKDALARAAGADEVVRYTTADFAPEVRRLTDGVGAHVVYDSVGRTTFAGSLDALRPRGLLVLYGQSSGPVPPFDIQMLNAKGSLFITRPTLSHYTATREELLWRAGDLFSAIVAGTLSVRIDRTVALADAAEAHRYIEGRQTKGKVLLLPAATQP